MKLLAVAFCLLLAAPAAADPELAQHSQRCHDAAEIARALATKYGEAPIALGLQLNGDLLHIWRSPDGSTWTAVTTSPEGVSCIASAGRDWERLPVVLVEGDPT